MQSINKTIEKWMKDCILLFLKKGDFGITNNYSGITLIAISAKIYNALLLSHIQPEIKKILRKNQNGFRRNCSTTSYSDNLLNYQRSMNLKATLLFIDFSKAFDSIHIGKMEQILLLYNLPKETYHYNHALQKQNL